MECSLSRWTDLSVPELADRCVRAGLTETTVSDEKLYLRGAVVLQYSHCRWVLLPLLRPTAISEPDWSTFMQVIEEVTDATPIPGALPPS